MRIRLFCLLTALSVPYALATPTEQTVYGLAEQVQILDPAFKAMAKLDTGAETASLSARNIERFINEKDGKEWVRFKIAAKGAPKKEFVMPLARISRIKRRAGDYDPEQDANTATERPVIELDVCMGQTLRRIEVNLTDRSAFTYPVLIGSNALSRFNALIDPSRTHTAGQPSCSMTTANAAE